MGRRHLVLRRVAPVAALLGGLLVAQTSKADVTHLVARGHTIEAIAHRYHVSVKAILDANHLTDPRHLKVGETLTIPGAASVPGRKAGPGKAEAPSYAMRSKTPGIIHATRLATGEAFVVRASTRRGHVSPNALKTFEHLMRSGSDQSHPIDPRLIALVTIVSDHFGGRRLEVVSGYRPYRSTQYTRHSNHNIGHAIDFRIAGVPNEVLRDYCRTLRNVGVGYYPNSTFVHLDARTSPAFWIDYSHPGEPPRYNAPDVDADEGTSDVADEPHPPESTLVPGAEPAGENLAPAPSTPAGPPPMPNETELPDAPDLLR